jgi:hypothetical protein
MRFPVTRRVFAGALAGRYLPFPARHRTRSATFWAAHGHERMRTREHVQGHLFVRALSPGHKCNNAFVCAFVSVRSRARNKLRDMRAHPFERVFAGVPREIAIVEADQSSARVPDGEFGGAFVNAEPRHERARRSAQIMKPEIDTAALDRASDELCPTRK